MKHLDKCVNVIPVIAKADTLTLEEREAFKKRVRFIYLVETPVHNLCFVLSRSGTGFRRVFFFLTPISIFDDIFLKLNCLEEKKLFCALEC